MTEPKYQVNDMVEVSDAAGSLQFGGDFVLITEVSKIGDVWCYDFVIPERRGGVPEHLVARLVAHGIAPPKQSHPGLSGALREALGKLTGEAAAMLGMSGVRECIGNTNMACLQLRVDEARAALSLSSPIEPKSCDASPVETEEGAGGSCSRATHALSSPSSVQEPHEPQLYTVESGMITTGPDGVFVVRYGRRWRK